MRIERSHRVSSPPPQEKIATSLRRHHFKMTCSSSNHDLFKGYRIYIYICSFSGEFLLGCQVCTPFETYTQGSKPLKMVNSEDDPRILIFWVNCSSHVRHLQQKWKPLKYYSLKPSGMFPYWLMMWKHTWHIGVCIWMFPKIGVPPNHPF